MPILTSESRLIRHKNTTFSPSDLANLALWLKADALALNDGDAVSTWTDSSGNSRHATQTGASTLMPTYKTNIINGKPVVRFDGGDYLSHSVIASDPTALTIFIVAKRGTGAITMVAWGHRSETTRLIQVSYASNATDLVLQLRSSGNSIKQPTIVSVTPANAHIYTARFNKAGNSHQLWYNGGSVASDTTAFGAETFTSSLETVGAGNNGSYGFNFTGDMAEQIIYDAVLSDTNRGKVETYLASKYAITLA